MRVAAPDCFHCDYMLKRTATIPLTGALYWLGLPLLVTLAGALLPDDYISHSTLLMLYLLAVLVGSLRIDYLGVMAASLLSFFLFNFFHTEPVFSLLMQDPSEFISTMLFVCFALIAGRVSHKLQLQLRSLKLQEEFHRAQITLSQRLHDIDEPEDVLPLLDRIAREVFGGEVSFRLLPPHSNENPEDGWHLTWVLSPDTQYDPERQAMLMSFKEQVQTTLEKLTVSKALHQAERKSDEEVMRSTLLSAFSKDLKSPLSNMMEAASTLLDSNDALTEEEQRRQLDTIQREAQRLDGCIQNLLDMTRLGEDTLPLSRERITVEEIYQVVGKRISRKWPEHRVKFKTEGDLPSLKIHPALVEQALFNAVDNAIKAAGEDSEIIVKACRENNRIIITICDQGPGLPESQWEAVFDQFYTFNQGNDYEKGAGLGLSICRSILRVHGGEAKIVPPPEGFTHCLQLSLPRDSEESI